MTTSQQKRDRAEKQAFAKAIDNSKQQQQERIMLSEQVDHHELGKPVEIPPEFDALSKMILIVCTGVTLALIGSTILFGQGPQPTTDDEVAWTSTAP